MHVSRSSLGESMLMHAFLGHCWSAVGDAPMKNQTESRMEAETVGLLPYRGSPALSRQFLRNYRARVRQTLRCSRECLRDRFAMPAGEHETGLQTMRRRTVHAVAVPSFVFCLDPPSLSLCLLFEWRGVLASLAAPAWCTLYEQSLHLRDAPPLTEKVTSSR